MTDPNGSTGGELTPLGYSTGYWDDGELVQTRKILPYPRTYVRSASGCLARRSSRTTALCP